MVLAGQQATCLLCVVLALPTTWIAYVIQQGVAVVARHATLRCGICKQGIQGSHKGFTERKANTTLDAKHSKTQYNIYNRLGHIFALDK